MKNVSVNELNKRIEAGEKLQLVDVRGAGEYSVGHVPGAVNMPLDEVESRLHDLRSDESVVLICQSGRRACMAHELLESDRDDLLILEGGTSGWVEAGLPVIGSRTVRWSIERQVRLAAGLLVLTGVGLGFLVHPGWYGLAGFVGAGLTFAGLTNVCGMASLFAVMPWNKAKKGGTSDATKVMQS